MIVKIAVDLIVCDFCYTIIPEGERYLVVKDQDTFICKNCVADKVRALGGIVIWN